VRDLFYTSGCNLRSALTEPAAKDEGRVVLVSQCILTRRRMISEKASPFSEFRFGPIYIHYKQLPAPPIPIPGAMPKGLEERFQILAVR
jgi:hypothetical protein